MVENSRTHIWSRFAQDQVISQEFFASITPQQNGVIERKNRVVQEMARAMLYNKDVARNL